MLDRWRNTIQNMDCIEGMKSLPNHSVDLVIADPPYNLSKGGDWSWDNTVKLQGFGGAWRKRKESWDDMTLEEYFRFAEAWLTQVKRVLKPTGSFWICGTYHNMGIINVLLQQLDMEILNEIVWYKRNSFPNLSGRRFTASHETLLWGHVSGKERKYYFDYEAIKNADFPEDLLKKPGKQMRTVWDIPNNKTPEELRYGTHPAQKPLRLMTRILLATSRVGDLVLVPFAGVGSECVAAQMLQRDYIGFEINPEYYQIAQRRLKVAPVEMAAQPDTPDDESSDGAQLSLPFRIVADTSKVRERMSEYQVKSIAELSRKSGVSRPKIHEYLRGDSPLASTFIRLCQYLDLDPNEAITLVDELPPHHPVQSQPQRADSSNGSKAQLPPVIKWSGGKRSQVSRIVEFFPPFETYYEPFVGGGSVLGQVAPARAVCGDICAPLIALWELIRDDPEKLLRRYEADWLRLQKEGHTVYYEIRDRFNANPNPYDLFFLSRTCVNGLIRFNRDGKFNNSLHHTRKGIAPERLAKVLEAWSERVRSVEFRVGDYRETTAAAHESDFVYLDPPYFHTRGRYYGTIDFAEFVTYLEDLNCRGVRFALSLDGSRGDRTYAVELPAHVYKRRLALESGNSSFKKVMDKRTEMVTESLYLNW